MIVEFYTDFEKFKSDTREVLLEHEAQNNLFLGNLLYGQYNENWLLITVKEDGGSVLLSCLLTPPFNLLVYETGNRDSGSALEWLIDAIVERNYNIPGILCKDKLAERFAAYYCKKANVSAHKELDMNLMILDKAPRASATPGRLRILSAEDLFFVPYWELQFNTECGLPRQELEDMIRKAKRDIDAEKHYIWEDRVPVSQAVNGRNTVNGGGVNGGYTPPVYRGRGDSTACVGAVCRKMFGQGKQFCCLFADKEKPVSNKVYKNIGFQTQCVFSEIKFCRED